MKDGQSAQNTKNKQRSDSQPDRSAVVLEELKPLDPDAKSPADIWFDFFSKRKPNGRTIAELVFRLHEEEEHEQVSALIEAALTHGHQYSWMYEVLAISYRLEKRPQADIERALLSAVDPNVDFESMMFSSAYLTRFDNKRPALRMYQQASRQNPVQAAPYVLGLKLAQELEEIDAIEWAVVGILNYAWTEDYEFLHKRARVAAKATHGLLLKMGQTQRAEEFQRAIAEADKRDLVVEVFWNGKGDIDLSVEDPKGEVANWENPVTLTGGVHVRDGSGPKQENCHEKYVAAQAFSGEYLLRINHVWGDIVAGRVIVKVTKYQGTDREKTTPYSVTLSNKDQYLRVILKEGRRKQRNPAIKESPQTQLQLWNRPSKQPTLRGPARLTVQQQQVLRQFLGGGTTPQRGVGAGLVGGAAIGIAPTITPIVEGTTLGVAAVISDDRRYVRIGVNATFNKIVDVFRYSLSNGSTQRANGN